MSQSIWNILTNNRRLILQTLQEIILPISNNRNNIVLKNISVFQLNFIKETMYHIKIIQRPGAFVLVEAKSLTGK